MGNIFKSYLKLFLKSWVETIGSIVFLIIFTMVTIGMSATPIQLSLNAINIKSQTNTWDNQMQKDYRYSSEFVQKFFFKDPKQKNANKRDYIFNYNGEDISLPIEIIFSKEAHKLNDLYVKNYWTESCKDSTMGPKQCIIDKQVNSYSRMARYFFLLGEERKVSEYFNNPFPKKESKRPSDEEITWWEELTMGMLFENNIKEQLNNGYLKNFNSYFINNILDSISQVDSNFKYASFWNMTYKRKDEATNIGYSYNFRSANPTFNSKGWTNDNGICNLVLTEGRLPNPVVNPNNSVEVIVNERFAKQNNATIGQTFTIEFRNPDLQNNSQSLLDTITFKVVGYGYKYGALTPQNYSGLSTSIENHGEFYVDSSFFTKKTNKIRGPQFKSTSNAPLFWEERYIKDFGSKNVNSPFTIQKDKEIKLFEQGVSPFKGYASHSGIKDLTTLYIITWIYIAIGIILFILAFTFILFVLKKEINSTRKQLGVFKSLGYKTSELTWIFSVKTFISMLIGIGFGFITSIPFQIQAATIQYNSMVVFNYEIIYSNPLFLFSLIVLVPIAFMGISYFVILKFLSESALNLLSSGPKQKQPKVLIWIIRILIFPVLIAYLVNQLILYILKKRSIGFTYRLQNAFISSSRGKFYIIVSLFGFTSFLLTLQLRAIPVIKAMLNGAFNIAQPELNHFINLEDVDPLVLRDELEIDKNRDYEINYIDINKEGYSSVEEYAYKNMAYTKEINLLMDYLANYRFEQFDNNPQPGTWRYNQSNSDIVSIKFDDALKIKLSLQSNMIALFYPLDLVLKLETNKLDENTFNQIYKDSITNYNEFLKEDGNPSTSLMNLKPIYKDEETGKEINSAIALNDVGKYICVSTPFELDCTTDNLDNFKEKILSMIFNPQYSSKKDNDYLASIIKALTSNKQLLKLVSQFFNTASGVNTILSANSVIFDGTQESFYLKKEYFMKESSEVDQATIYAFDTTGQFGGDFTKTYNLGSQTLKELNQELYVEDIPYENREQIIYPAIISFRLSKLLNLNPGDVFIINMGLKGEPRKIKVIDINYNDTLLENIYMDYSTYIKMIGSQELMEKTEKGNYYFNVLLSNKKSNEGKIDLKDIPKSLASFRSYKDSIAMASWMGDKNNSNWLNSWLDIYLSMLKSLQEGNNNLEILDDSIIANLPSKEDIEKLLKSPKQSYFIDPSSIISMPILKIFIDEMMKEFTKSMGLYMGINLILVTILLIVIMNIIISDAKNIITVMRSLGYSNRKINWIIIGKYVTGALITFIFAFIFSLMVWYTIQSVVWTEFKVLVMIPTAIWIPFIAAIILGTVVLLGWISAVIQIRKLPLTYLVS